MDEDEQAKIIMAQLAAGDSDNRASTEDVATNVFPDNQDGTDTEIAEHTEAFYGELQASGLDAMIPELRMRASRIDQIKAVAGAALGQEYSAVLEQFKSVKNPAGFKKWVEATGNSYATARNLINFYNVTVALDQKGKTSELDLFTNLNKHLAYTIAGIKVGAKKRGNEVEKQLADEVLSGEIDITTRPEFKAEVERRLQEELQETQDKHDAEMVEVIAEKRTAEAQASDNNFALLQARTEIEELQQNNAALNAKYQALVDNPEIRVEVSEEAKALIEENNKLNSRLKDMTKNASQKQKVAEDLRVELDMLLGRLKTVDEASSNYANLTHEIEVKQKQVREANGESVFLTNLTDALVDIPKTVNYTLAPALTALDFAKATSPDQVEAFSAVIDQVENWTRLARQQTQAFIQEGVWTDMQ